jgi:serine/alanine adding enzyme
MNAATIWRDDDAPAAEARPATRSEAGISVAGKADGEAWDAYVAARSAGEAAGRATNAVSAYHEWAWRGVFERSFGHVGVYLIARNAGAIAGVLPLVAVRSVLFGRLLTSLPFVNYGGVVADSDEVGHALVDRAAAIAREGGYRHVELRHVDQRFAGLPCRQHKVAMRLALADGMWDRLDRKVRNQIRKAEKSGLAAEHGGADLLDDFYRVFARNMRDLGTPVHAKRFFGEVLSALPDRARVVVVRLDGTPVAAALTLRTGPGTEVPWASSVKPYNHLCPNHLLYWEAINAAVAEGCTTFDFGRSTPGEGTYKFKEQWGAEPVPLHWEYAYLRDGAVPDQGPANPRFRLAIDAWQRLPLWVANAVGPRIVRSIP